VELAERSKPLRAHQSLDDYYASFLEDCRLRGMTDYSIHSYSSALRSFYRHLGVLGIHDATSIDKDAVRDYVRVLREERKLSISTIENHLSSISAFFDYLIYEDVIDTNIALSVRKRYVRRYKAETPGEGQTRKLITVEQLRALVDSILAPRDKAVIVLLAKTGIRRSELMTIDVQDIDFPSMKIILKPKAKRSNRVIFFDEECARFLQDWLLVRQRYARSDVPALFITTAGGRLDKNGVYAVVTSHAARAGLHNLSSSRLEDHFTPHCLRHWFTTYLRRNGMPREMVQELRGDIRSGAMDIYYHIDEEQLRSEYLRCIPRLGTR
jgi:integrase/recombinase XerD